MPKSLAADTAFVFFDALKLTNYPIMPYFRAVQNVAPVPFAER